MYVCLGLRKLIYSFKSRGIGVQHPKLSPSLQVLGLLRVAMSDPQNVWLLPPPLRTVNKLADTDTLNTAVKI